MCRPGYCGASDAKASERKTKECEYVEHGFGVCEEERGIRLAWVFTYSGFTVNGQKVEIGVETSEDAIDICKEISFHSSRVEDDLVRCKREFKLYLFKCPYLVRSVAVGANKCDLSKGMNA